METYQPDSFGLRTEERTSFQRYSPTSQSNIDSTTKPPRAGRDVDVLLKANEVLQRSIKYNNTTSTNDILYNNTRSQVLAPVSVGSYENTTKTYDVLNRANEILKKSANYSKETGISSSKNSPLKYYSSSNQYGGVGKSGSGYYPEKRSYGESYTAYGSSAEKGNNPRDILSKVEIALQNSSQIPSDGNYYSGEARNNSLKLGSLIRNEIRNSQLLKKSQNDFNTVDAYRNNSQYQTPQRNYSYNTTQETLKYQPSNYDVAPSVYKNQGIENITSQIPSEINRAYVEALRRSQEIVLRNEEELNKNGYRSSPVGEKNLRSSYVMERQTATSQYENEGYSPSIDRDIPPPGIHVQAQPAIKPKFVEEYLDDGTIYKGEKIRTAKHGRGEFIQPDGSKYEGEFLNGKMHGLGTLTLFNNERYVGKFKYDKVHGVGVFHRNNGEAISAEWENNKLARIA